MNQRCQSSAKKYLWRPNAKFPARIGLGLILLGCGVILISGCGQGPGYSNITVGGTVAIDGMPVPKGYITFTPDGSGQGPVVGAKIVNGEYRCEAVPLGKHRVTFVAQAEAMRTMIEPATGMEREIPQNILPPQYHSGLDAEVGKETTTLDFPLKTRS